MKEITPPVGYLLDEEEHDVNCNYEGDQVETVKRNTVSKEDVIKQPFQLIKAADNDKTDADLLKGAGFSAYLISSLTVKDDGSYDFTNATPTVLTEDGKQKCLPMNAAMRAASRSLMDDTLSVRPQHRIISCR